MTAEQSETLSIAERMIRSDGEPFLLNFQCYWSARAELIHILDESDSKTLNLERLASELEEFPEDGSGDKRVGCMAAYIVAEFYEEPTSMGQLVEQAREVAAILRNPSGLSFSQATSIQEIFKDVSWATNIVKERVSSRPTIPPGTPFETSAAGIPTQRDHYAALQREWDNKDGVSEAYQGSRIYGALLRQVQAPTLD